MNRSLILILSLFFVFANNICTRPLDIRLMSGWYKIFSPNKKYLSPFEGFVFSKNVENYYRFGKIKVERHTGTSIERDLPVVKGIISGDANIKLLYYLFYDRWSEFLVADAPSKIAHYLDAKAIGKIISCMDVACETGNSSYIKADATVVKTWRTLQQLTAELEKSEKGVTTPKKIETLKKRIPQATKTFDSAVRKARLNHYPVETVEDIMIATVQGKEHPASMLQAKREAHELAQIIIDALQESGNLITAPSNISQSPYPLHMPFLSLLSFLFEKAKDSEAFITYIHQLPPACLNNDWPSLIVQPYDGANFLTTLKNDLQAPGSESNLDEILNWYLNSYRYYEHPITNDKKLETLHNYYEEICLEGSLLSNALPPFVGDFYANVQGVDFKACGEATALNWIQFLLAKLGLYNKETNAFNALAIFPAMKNLFEKKQQPFDAAALHAHTQALTAFFSRYTAHDFNREETLNEWATLISNRTGVKYMRRKKEGAEEIKENKHPAYHPIAGVDNQKIYGDYAVPLDDSYFLYELTSYPSCFVQLTNELLGTSCTDFAALCKLFDITCSENLAAITDQDAWSEYKKYILITEIEDKPINVEIMFHYAHGHMQNLTQAYKRSYGKVLTFLLEHYDKSSIIPNLLTSSFSPLQETPLPDILDGLRYQNELQTNRDQLVAIDEQLLKDPNNEQLRSKRRTLANQNIQLPKHLHDSIPARFKIANDSLGNRFSPALKRHLLFSHDLSDNQLLMPVIQKLALATGFRTLIVDSDYLFAHIIIRQQEELELAVKQQQPEEQVQKLTDELRQVKEWESEAFAVK